MEFSSEARLTLALSIVLVGALVSLVEAILPLLQLDVLIYSHSMASLLSQHLYIQEKLSTSRCLDTVSLHRPSSASEEVVVTSWDQRLEPLPCYLHLWKAFLEYTFSPCHWIG